MEKICQLNWTRPGAPPVERDAWAAPPEAGVPWGAAPADVAGEAPASPAAAPPGPMDAAEVLRRTIDEIGLPHVPAAHAATVVDEAEFLLQVAAEVEHGLLVQYLYAAYSLANDAPHNWRKRLVNVAIQEMDHLLSVQNMLLGLGKRPYLDRGNFPPSSERAKFYPFPFQFEPVSEASLGKYVAAESPSDILGAIDRSQLSADQNRWFDRAVASGKAGAHVPTINHVGVLYAALYWMFQEDDTPVLPWLLPADKFAGQYRHLAEADLAAALIEREGQPSLEFRSLDGPEFPPPPPPPPLPSEVDPDDATPRHRVAWTIKTRSDVREAISQIAEQGEGTKITGDSHFVEFVNLFGQFIEIADAGTPPPVLGVPTDPTARGDATAPGRITRPGSLLWARLFNVRYWILLTELALALSETDSENTGGDGAAERGQLIANVFQEMKGAFGIKSLANRLAKLPLKEDGTGLAAAPFDMPEPLTPDGRTLPDSPEANRDFLVRLVSESSAIIDELLAFTGPEAPNAGEKANLAQLQSADKVLAAAAATMTFTP